jgi:hypothetical protein
MSDWHRLRHASRMSLSPSLTSVITTMVHVQDRSTHVRKANLPDEIACGISLRIISLYGAGCTGTSGVIWSPQDGGARKLRGQE